jgi:hypothetical protein
LKIMPCHCGKHCFCTIIKQCSSLYEKDGIRLCCSPVGNETILTNKVDFALSGFCVARRAESNYSKSLKEKININFHEAIDESARENTFNTDTMKKGIEVLFSSLDINAYGKNLNFSSANSWLFTQMLCCISVNDKSKAFDIFRCIKKYNDVKRFAELSLERWYLNIITHVNEGGCILIMGDEAAELLKTSTINMCNEIKILDSKIAEEKSLFGILSVRFNLFPVVHAAALAPIYNWLTSQQSQVKNDLQKKLTVNKKLALAQLMEEASKKNLFLHIENPAEWQREIRKERSLPGRKN